ncbi:alpha/beta hydrolase [Gilvibacter sp.]|uniref:alpha/beta fold hydrolase n=1 Tax=Gilvibacter sp. TaxID=2729997 RepID=UPI0025C49DFC|nr:alpha/beta hydrolase [Gilvibacter sp.]NQX77117.1 alpha/beta hydrolase [Gilvibacter sp.]
MKKPPVILLHGALGSHEQMASMEVVLSATHQVYRFNFEGHGGRRSDRPFSMEVFAQNVLDFMKEHQLDSTDFFGYSMGGYVALTLAQTHPQLIKKLVTYGTKFAWTPESAAKEVKQLKPEKILEKVPRFAAFLEQVHQPNDWKQVLDKTAAMMLALGDGAAFSEPELQDIKVPVRILIGDQDQMVSLQESQWAAKHLGQGICEIIQDGVHPLEKNNPEKLAEATINFLNH